MNSEIRDLFTELEPPPGGAERFAARLDAEAAAPSASRRHAFAAAAACAAIALAAVVVWLREPNDAGPPLAADGPPPVEVYNAPQLDRLLGRPLRTTELTVTLDAETLPVTRLATASEKIRIYRLGEPAPAAAP